MSRYTDVLRIEGRISIHYSQLKRYTIRITKQQGCLNVIQTYAFMNQQPISSRLYYEQVGLQTLLSCSTAAGLIG